MTMRRTARLTVIAVLLVSATLLGQQAPNVPHPGYVYPAGGRLGTTVRVVIGGQYLDGTTAAIVSGAGVNVQVVSFDKPLNGQPLTELRDKLQEMQKQPATPALQAEIAALRDKIQDFTRRNQAPVLSERVTLDVTIAPDAPLGARQLRLQTALGLTSPLIFVVGSLPEFQERDVKNTPADAELTITLPATVNGRLIPGDIDRVKFPARTALQYMPGDVDRYRFTARKGEHLVCRVSARDLMPYLADAVPGWVQATLTLYDAHGRELAYNDDDGVRPDPMLELDIPIDGDYVVEIRDAIYRGRDDFVYRLSVGDAATVAGVTPRNPNASARFSLDGLSETAEKEPNNAVAGAQRVKWPTVISGRIQAPGDWDVFSVAGRAGDEVVAEVIARRLDSPLDSVLELVDAAGRRLARNDDTDDKGAGLETHHADSYLRATLPAAGTYYVRVGDIQQHGGPAFTYQLRLSAPRPDFELRVSPSSLNVSGGTTIPVTVTAIRHDGFAGDIGIALAGAPAGFVLSGARVPAGEERVRMTLTVPPATGTAPSLLPLRVEGRASVAGKTEVRMAVPADDVMQAFAYRHLVTADALRVLVSPRSGTRVPPRVMSTATVTLSPGGSAIVRVSLPLAYAAFDHLEFALDDGPAGVALRDSVVSGNTAMFALQADAAKARAGARGNLIVTVSGERVPAANAANQVRRRIAIGVLPAIMFEIAGRPEPSRR